MLRALILVVLAFASGACLPAPAAAQDATGAPRAILVLDGSGSMWGQIGGVNKIVIARQVVKDLLTSLPPEMQLGLMTYGARRKGDCSDIQMLVPPGTDRGAIAGAVDAINPKGKTPLSQAVIEAAQALKYTEEKATVILVSDGIETCDLDPCKVGASLEAAGVDFTAHVIGFDVADPATRAQLQCLAASTGGTFRTAESAQELADALKVVAAPPPAPPKPAPKPPAPVVAQPAKVTFRALDGVGGEVIADGLSWSVTTAAGTVLDGADEAAPVLPLPAGQGTARVTRAVDGATAATHFTVAAGKPMVVTVTLPAYAPAASLEAPDSAPAGARITVTWSGPNAPNDFVASARPDMDRANWVDFAYLHEGEGNTVTVRLPPEPGPAELRYVMGGGNRVLARRPITVTPLAITLTPPAAATIGTEADVPWQGPNYANDFIAIARPGDADGRYSSYAYTSSGSPAKLDMPAEPGAYELRYVLGESTHVAARVPFTVGDATVAVSSPGSAPAGATIQIGWRGPDAANDYIAIAPAGAEVRRNVGYTYTARGNPLALALPMDPGDYELRYVSSAANKVLARAPITLTPVTASLDAPAQVAAGADIAVGWQGPDYDRDYVAIARPDDPDQHSIASGYTGNGNPVHLQAPTAPGAYELRYVANDNGTAILARRTITVTAVSASLDAPPSAPAGARVKVGWTGPAGDRDFIALTTPDDRPNGYLEYAPAQEGSPAEVPVPTAPGTYELRYVQDGDPVRVLAAVPLEVTPVSAQISAPKRAPAGSEVAVTWSGPGGDRDYIAIAKPGDDPDGSAGYAYTREGSPARVPVPTIPGSYELRYVQDGDPVQVLATAPLEVTAVTATLDAAGSAPANATLPVGWSGPGGDRDYIAVATPDQDAGSYVTYAATGDGTPLDVQMPAHPGRYELRYVQAGDPVRVLARAPLDITPVAATLDAPENAATSESVTVGWSGPDYPGDYVALSRAGSADGDYETYTYTSAGTPLSVAVPDTPGNYELRYVMTGARNVVLARAPLRVH